MDVFYRSSPDDSRTRASILRLSQFPRKTEESLDGAASRAELFVEEIEHYRNKKYDVEPKSIQDLG